MSCPERLCAGDIGSNAIKVRMVETVDGHHRVLSETRYPVRLGTSVFESRRISPDAVGATVDVFREVAGQCRRIGVSRARIVATSATREAENRNELTEIVYRETGLRIEVISGPEEARLLALGVRADMKPGVSNLVIDVGGGSTEIIYTEPTLEIRSVHSLRLGAVRMAGVHGHGPGGAAGARMEERVRDQIRSALEAASLPDAAGGKHVVGAAGTMRALLQAKHRGSAPESSAFTTGELADLIREMEGLGPEEIAFRFGLDRRRAQVIIPGALIVAELMAFHGLQSVTVSSRGLRDGLLHEMAAEKEKNGAAERTESGKMA